MSAVTVTHSKIVNFPTGMLFLYRGESGRHVRWTQTNDMIVQKQGRRIVVRFADGESTIYPTSAVFTDFFPGTIIKRALRNALRMRPGAEDRDNLTGIYFRRFAQGQIFEVRMPCGEEACVKVATVKRLLKELS